MQIMDGKQLSAKIEEQLKKEIEKLPSRPGLTVIQIGNDEASNIYVRGKKKLALEIGMNFNHLLYDDKVTEEELLIKINELNNDSNVHGILLQLPIPNHLNKMALINEIDPKKDVDGLTVLNTGYLNQGVSSLISCTPKGVMRILKEYNVDLMGKHVVIVGRSNLVGKPLASLFLNSDATVTVCHSHTVNLSSYTKQADVLVVAVGKKDLIRGDMLKDGVIVIDVGINRVDDKLYGDVNFEEASLVAAMITPVPGGIGPMTKICLMENVIEAYKNRLNN